MGPEPGYNLPTSPGSGSVRFSLRLILFLVVGISLVTFVVARYEVRVEKRGLRADLERRAEVLAESLQEIVEPILEKGSQGQLQRIVERFGSRERLVGVAIYNDRGETLAISSNFRARYHYTPPQHLVAQAHLQAHGFGQFVSLEDKTMHVYVLPLRRQSSPGGFLMVFHDASYIEAQTARILRDTLWRVIVEVLLIVSITFLIIRWTIVSPIAKTARWVRDLRIGRAVPRPDLPDEDLFKPLYHEVKNLAQSLIIRSLCLDL